MHAGGVRAASGIFQKQRVLEIRTVLGGQPEFFGNAHAENTTAHGVTHGLAFGQVECKGQGGNNF
jgi:hypothetical protein